MTRVRKRNRGLGFLLVAGSIVLTFLAATLPIDTADAQNASASQIKLWRGMAEDRKKWPEPCTGANTNMQDMYSFRAHCLEESLVCWGEGRNGASDYESCVRIFRRLAIEERWSEIVQIRNGRHSSYFAGERRQQRDAIDKPPSPENSTPTSGASNNSTNGNSNYADVDDLDASDIEILDVSDEPVARSQNASGKACGCRGSDYELFGQCHHPNTAAPYSLGQYPWTPQCQIPVARR